MSLGRQGSIRAVLLSLLSFSSPFRALLDVFFLPPNLEMNDYGIRFYQVGLRLREPQVTVISKILFTLPPRTSFHPLENDIVPNLK